jgi:putative flippase GtrA
MMTSDEYMGRTCGCQHGDNPVTVASTIEIVVPVYNEEVILERSITRLRRYLDDRFPFPTVVTIADNASTDGTWEIARQLEERHPGVRALHLDQKGRGRALRAAWTASAAAVVAYMDVDLATDLDGLLPLVAPLLSGHSDLAIGSRLARGARVSRGPKREIISRSYNLLLRTVMRSTFTDAQCGFKALRSDTARALLPLVGDQAWFFDTEMLVLAEASGLRIHEVPVDWVDDPDSRVDVLSTALADLRGVARVSRRLAAGSLRLPTRVGPTPETSRFAGIGGLSTVAYLLAFLALTPALGALLANAVALSAAAAGHLAAHRRLTAPSGPGTARRQRMLLWREAAVAYATGLLLSTGWLAALVTVGMGSLVDELLVVLAANAVVSIGRYVSFRARMFRRRDAVGALPAAMSAVLVGGAPR